MKVKKILLIVFGCIFLALGALGSFLPFLPTVPFLLVASFCFTRSSERLNNWFRHTKLYKNNLESFVKGQGMTFKTKAKIVISVTILMAIGFIMMKNTIAGRVCLAIVWALHIVAFTLFIKDKEEPIKDSKNFNILDDGHKENRKELYQSLEEYYNNEYLP